MIVLYNPQGGNKTIVRHMQQNPLSLKGMHLAILDYFATAFGKLTAFPQSPNILGPLLALPPLQNPIAITHRELCWIVTTLSRFNEKVHE